jgi:hypothetical protein
VDRRTWFSTDGVADRCGRPQALVTTTEGAIVEELAASKFKVAEAIRVVFIVWRLTFAAFKKCLKNGKAPTIVDLEEEGGDKGILPRWPRGHKAMASDIKRDATALALSETFKGWIANKEEAIAKREEKK